MIERLREVSVGLTVVLWPMCIGYPVNLTTVLGWRTVWRCGLQVVDGMTSRVVLGEAMFANNR